MILFYLDESGTGLGDPSSPFFVLAVLGIDARHWQEMDGQVAGLKRRWFGWAKTEDFEIKGREMRRGDKFFRGQPWETRVRAIVDVAELIAELPCQIFAVQVDKRDLPEFVASPNDLYRLAFWRLLDELDAAMANDRSEPGMLLVDNRSDLHSSIQDRRLVDAYRDWTAARSNPTHLVELPWFGFSAFYAGLQLADFVAYMIDFVHNERDIQQRGKELYDAFHRFSKKIQLVHIP